MVHTITMPDLGQTVSEGKVLRWLKKPGAKVSRGEPLLEVETDKVTMEVESYVSGYLRATLIEEGQMGSALSPIAIVTDDSDEPFERPLGEAGSRDSSVETSGSTPSKASSLSQKVPASLGGEAATKRGTGVPPARTGETPVPQRASTSLQITRSQKLAIYRRMLLCRMFEDRIYYLFLEGRLPGTVHQSQGQEASAVGVSDSGM